METHIASTPFGSRPMSLALLAAQKDSRDIPEGKAVDKWQVYRDLCEGKSLVGIGDRALAILAALLSFYPDNELSEENGLIVFPSNKQLSLRAHGMPDTTLRRHLAALLDCGLILRRDSPNGKRYARKGRGGDFEDAFGFSLAPLLVRADEFQEAAERVRAENRALKVMRERITLYRRDIGKLIEAAVEEGVPGDWGGLWRRFRAIVDRLPRRATVSGLEPFVANLAVLREEIDNLLDSHMNTQESDGNESHNGRQQSDSNTNSISEFEPALEKSGPTTEPVRRPDEKPRGYPLGLVLKACPEIVNYAVDGIANWRDLMTTAAQVRGYLGVSPSAYEDACHVMGQETAAIVIACILQRAQHINSAGGYLRVLTEKARAEEFSVGPMLMAALKANATPGKMAG
ncbi:plasmid replication protein RepC [Mesorhizobium sp. P16.1]|uniref:plasmid replication protein RepC n=1 Tax=unclassified Mesorhizobium TaxID=325217 RepID=UPI0021A2CBAD|nr:MULTISPECIES: plasmid replication protein RepC [unclassified Mesorhizobium]MCT2580910.1 plasmid replication protein RepC [Mesorhizobium sp. P13.3]MDF3169951.1 plasmid replication protein RepC [Mesorhizobium sp. P16.1]MDF3181423.1 plasmid replication protein RepC [Mesorhizobium sp. P17.1]MDF3186910.1 plasmid replication protein RepC [Mesorhizobium sp. ICCV3110.1]